MTAFSKGKYAQFISDRSGMAFPYKEMVREWNGARVHISEYEPKQPQLQPKPVGADGQGLPQARPVYLKQDLQEQNYLQQIFYLLILSQQKMLEVELELYIVFPIPIVEYKLETM
jgi:hypothetical protein